MRKLTPRSSVETLKREAKRWLKALRADDPDARARLDRAIPSKARDLTLRDVQHALAIEYGYDGWAVLEWECCIKDSAQGAQEGAPFIAKHIIQAVDKAFDDFAGAGTDENMLRKLLGL